MDNYNGFGAIISSILPITVVTSVQIQAELLHLFSFAYGMNALSSEQLIWLLCVKCASSYSCT